MIAVSSTSLNVAGGLVRTSSTQGLAGVRSQVDDQQQQHVQKTSVFDVLRRLLQSKNMMLSTGVVHGSSYRTPLGDQQQQQQHVQHAYVSMMAILQVVFTLCLCLYSF